MLVTVVAASAGGQATAQATAGVAPPPSGDWVRPTADTTGTTGPLAPWGKSATFTANDQTISGVDFGDWIKVTGTNLTLENCHFQGMVYLGPGPLTLRHCTSDSNINVDGSYRDVRGVLIDHCHVVCGSHDGIDLFSQSVGKLSDVTIVDTLVDGQTFPSGSTAHGDGLQVRGIDGLTVQRTVVDMLTVGGVQPQKNAALYFEDVNGGCRNMRFVDVDIMGGDPYQHTFYTNAVTGSTATNLAIRGRGGYVTRVKPSGWAFTNVTGPSGNLITP